MIKSKNYRTERKVTLVGKNSSVEATLKDLSINSAGVITPRGAAEGTELELLLEIPAFGEFTKLTINSVVSHRHNVENEFYLKLEFVNLVDSQLNAIEDFLDYKQRLIDLGQKKALDELLDNT